MHPLAPFTIKGFFRKDSHQSAENELLLSKAAKQQI